MKHSLRLKLFASFMLVIVVVVGGALAGTWFLLREHTLAARQQDLQVKGTELAGTMGLLYQKQGNFKDLDAILADEEGHVDFFEEQLGQIEQMTLPFYLSTIK